MDAMENLTEFFGAAKSALDLFRGIQAELPSGPLSEEAERQIETAAKALKVSEAQLAQSLGFRLCKCTWPPQIMLWHKDNAATICPACGDARSDQPTINRGESRLTRARQGR